MTYRGIIEDYLILRPYKGRKILNSSENYLVEFEEKLTKNNEIKKSEDDSKNYDEQNLDWENKNKYNQWIGNHRRSSSQENFYNDDYEDYNSVRVDYNNDSEQIWDILADPEDYKQELEEEK